MRLDIWSDIACPFCFMGKRRLEAALASASASASQPPGVPDRRQPEVHVHWRAFELQPDLPRAGVDPHAFYADKFGGSEAQHQVFDHVTAMGAADGIAFDFSAIKAPNTALAHQLVALAAEQSAAAQDAVVEALFKGHFEEGRDVADLDELLALVTDHEVPLDVAELRPLLAADARLDRVRADEQEAQRLGVMGVPFFVADGTLAISGAQPAPAIAALLDTARRQGEAGSDRRELVEVAPFMPGSG